MDYHTVNSLISLHSYLEWFENQPKDARIAIQKDMAEYLDISPDRATFYETKAIIDTNASIKSTRAPFRRRRRPS